MVGLWPWLWRCAAWFCGLNVPNFLVSCMDLRMAYVAGARGTGTRAGLFAVLGGNGTVVCSGVLSRSSTRAWSSSGIASSPLSVATGTVVPVACSIVVGGSVVAVVSLPKGKAIKVVSARAVTTESHPSHFCASRPNLSQSPDGPIKLFMRVTLPRARVIALFFCQTMNWILPPPPCRNFGSREAWSMA